MKCILFLGLCLLLCISYGCELAGSNDPVREFIPGTYIRYSSHEFGTEHDTLMIAAQHTDANTYSITRRWKYERILDGVLIEPEYKLTVTSGLYDPEQRLLQENESGNIFSFDPERNMLFDGHTKYTKL